MSGDRLYGVTARFNPLRWMELHRQYCPCAEHILDSGAQLTAVEVQYGKKPFVCDIGNVNHIGLRAESWVWSKECAINEEIKRLPDAEYIAWGDADVWHRKNG